MKCKTSKKTLDYLWRIFIVGLVNVLVIVVVANSTPVQALSKEGSQGSEVTQIQTKLKNWGYYTGNVDGIFGTQTKQAVIRFQNKNGLTADGIVGRATLAALGINSSSSGGSNGYGGYSESEFNLLAKVISAEARGEPYQGQVAVGAVILNRISHPSFPNTLSGVIYQPGAFSCIADRKSVV